jgi:uncharacterized protein
LKLSETAGGRRKRAVLQGNPEWSTVDPETLVLLVLAGFVASFIDAQVGGGGVITLPALLAAGLPPAAASATNKVGGTASALVASVNYLRSGLVPLRTLAWLAPLSLLGGAVGVWAFLNSDPSWLVPAVLAVMLAMVAYVLLRPRFGVEDRPRLGRWPLVAMGLAAFDIGTYDGLMGPGTGSFLLFALVSLLGYGFRRAAALGRVLNLASNVSALAYWSLAGHVVWSVGLPMAASMGVGGWVGSHVTLKHGDRWLKPLFVAITLVLMARLALRVL